MPTPLEANLEDLGGELNKLTPLQQRIYAIRMSEKPPLSARVTAEKMGIAYGTVSYHWTQIRTKLGRDPLIEFKEKGEVTGSGYEDFERLRNVSPDTIGKLTDMRLEAILRAIDTDRIASATLSELGSAAEKIARIRQLIRGEPTQILRVEQRDNLHKLWPQMLKELKRRGMSMEIDGSGEVRAVQQIEAEAVE